MDHTLQKKIQIIQHETKSVQLSVTHSNSTNGNKTNYLEVVFSQSLICCIDLHIMLMLWSDFIGLAYN